MNLLQSARWILKDKSFFLSDKEISFLKNVSKNIPLTEDQFSFLFSIHNRYIKSKVKQISKHTRDLEQYLAEDQKTLAIDAEIGENKAKTEA